MVKPTLSGKKQTTTQALGAGIARWIMQAGCGVMVLINKQEVGIVGFEMVEVFPGSCVLMARSDLGGLFSLAKIRIYRDTVRQIKSLIGLA